MSVNVEELLAGLGSGIESTPEVCGGDPRIAGTRIPVWTLEQYRRLGLTEAQILTRVSITPGNRSGQRLDDVSAHLDEIERQIRENEEA